MSRVLILIAGLVIIFVFAIGAIWYYGRDNSSQKIMVAAVTTTLRVGQKYSNGDLVIKLDSIKSPTSSVPGNRPFYSLNFSYVDLNFNENWDPMLWSADHAFSFADYRIWTTSFDNQTLTLEVKKQ